MSSEVAELKFCKTCHRELPYSEYKRQFKDGKWYYRSECKDCFTTRLGQKRRIPLNLPPDLRRCKYCQQELPLSEFASKGITKGKEYLATECKACYRHRHGQKPRKFLNRPDGMRLCSRCNQEFPATTEFFSRQGDGLVSRCKVCEKEYQREYRALHGDKIREQEREKAAIYRATHRDEVAAKMKKHVDANRDRINARNREWQRNHADEQKERRLEWRANNKHIVNASTARRRARKRGLADSLTTKEWESCLDYWQFRCAYCDTQLEFPVKRGASMDHFIPLSHPGCLGTIMENIVPACFSCNSSKHNRDALTWLIEIFGEQAGIQKFERVKNTSMM